VPSDQAGRRTKEIPVIFLTAKGGGEALAEGFESGAVMYINKPFTANKLLTIVNTMLEQAGSRRTPQS
jgi:DNA-binding response OmpR family regulator